MEKQWSDACAAALFAAAENYSVTRYEITLPPSLALRAAVAE